MQGEEGFIFWYGFGQNFIQALHMAKETLGRVWKDTWYYGYTGTGSVAQLTDQKGTLAATYSYDAFGNTSVQDYIGNITGNRNIIENYTLNPYTYNAEYTDASTGNQYLRARYYSPITGDFFTEDSYLGSLLEPLERNLYTYAENDSVNYRDPSGHSIKSKLKKAWNSVKSTASKAWNTVKTTVSNLYNKAKTGLHNYMNSSTYQSYFNNTGSSGGNSQDWEWICWKKPRQWRKLWGKRRI